MGSEFKSVSLGEVAHLRSGYSFKSSTWQDTGNPVIKITNVKDGRVDPTGCGYVSDAVASAASEWWTKSGDVLIAMTGHVGEVALIRDGEQYLVNQRVGRFELTSDKLNPQYLFYTLRLPHVRDFIRNISRGSVQANLSAKDAEQLRFSLPSRLEQAEICSALGVLDARIDLLRQTNATLEAIAQALFKSWFVDFDPVHAKAEGREPDATDAVSAALFPSEFEESELGLIPKGWSSFAVYDLAQFVNGAAYKAFRPNRERIGLPIVKIAELKAGITEQTAFSAIEMPQKYRIATGDILFSWSGNPDTSIDTFVWSFGEAWLNQHIFRVEPAAARERSFVLFALKYLRSTFAEIARDKQTTGLGHVTVADLKRLRFVKSPSAILEQWNKLADRLVERAFTAQRQAQTLADLRDTLLPRLMSGKLRLPEAEALLKEASE